MSRIMAKDHPDGPGAESRGSLLTIVSRRSSGARRPAGGLPEKGGDVSTGAGCSVSRAFRSELGGSVTQERARCFAKVPFANEASCGAGTRNVLVHVVWVDSKRENWLSAGSGDGLAYLIDKVACQVGVGVQNLL
jgi:hypothetical protein